MNKLKNFYNKHKAAIWTVGIMAAFIGAGIYIYRKGKHDGIEISEDDGVLDSVVDACTSGKNAREIDESVFTEVAPKIEDLLLWDDTTKETTFEKIYEVLIPLNGDPNEGLFKVTKKLVVNVADIGVEEVSCDQA